MGTFAKKDDLVYQDSEKYNEAYFSSMIPQINTILESRDVQDKLNNESFDAMEPKLSAQESKKENMIFGGVVLGAGIVASSIMGFLCYADTLRHKGQIKSKAIRYILEKFFRPIALGNQPKFEGSNQ